MASSTLINGVPKNGPSQLTWAYLDEAIVLDEYGITRQVTVNNGRFTTMKIAVGWHENTTLQSTQTLYW